MTTETKTEAAALRVNKTCTRITYADHEEDCHAVIVEVDDDGDIRFENDGDVVFVPEPTRELALAIAEAFTRLAEELPEAATQ